MNDGDDRGLPSVPKLNVPSLAREPANVKVPVSVSPLVDVIEYTVAACTTVPDVRHNPIKAAARRQPPRPEHAWEQAGEKCMATLRGSDVREATTNSRPNKKSSCVGPHRPQWFLRENR